MGTFSVYVEHPVTGATITLAHEDAETEDQAIEAIKRITTSAHLTFPDGVQGEIYAEQQAE